MKVTKIPASPPKPDIVITLSWNEAETLKAKLTGYEYRQATINELVYQLRRAISES